MPMFLALNIWMTVSQRMVADWSWLDARASSPARPRRAEAQVALYFRNRKE